MKLTPSLSLLALLLVSNLHAQRAAPAAAPRPALVPNPAVKLTEQQLSSVATQLGNLEKEIATKRRDFMSVIVGKLETASSSDQAALNFYLDCYSLVTIERKGGTKMEARDKEDALAKQMEGPGGKKAGQLVTEQQGDQGRAIKLGLRYLLLTLEAQECPDDGMKKMVPKLHAYIKDLIDSGDKLKGRASNMVKGGLGPIMEAYKLADYLTPKIGWNTDAADIGAMYDSTILPLSDLSSEASINTLWDSRIAAEGEFAKNKLAKDEYDLWLAHDLPKLRWRRAEFLYSKGPNPVNGLAAMLALIKELPGHPMAKEWMEQVRAAVESAAPSAAPAEKPIGTSS